MSKETRRRWVSQLCKIARPPLSALAEGRLRETMPVEAAPGQVESRKLGTHFEAFARTLAGIAPWLELDNVSDPAEAAAQQQFRDLACQALTQAVDPDSPDFLDFVNLPSFDGQGLVDSSWIAHALLRAPKRLAAALPSETQERLFAALRSTRIVLPSFNNWLLFAAMVEAALLRFTGEADRMRLDYAIRQHEQWYKGDGMYGDGPDFHWDYYNSFVIQPMLRDVMAEVSGKAKAWDALAPEIRRRSRRYAAVQERLIAPDGSFPVLGRSIVYRCGAFQLLAQMALQQDLPEGLGAAQVRCALNAVIQRTLEAPGTFDEQGWLRIGLCGSQPDLGEIYMSTGSLYLCTMAFLPLGLPETDPFWSNPDEPWTAVRAWRGENMPADQALY